MKIKIIPNFIGIDEPSFITHAGTNRNRIFDMSKRLIDIVIYGKVMSNGCPMTTIVVKRDVMDAVQCTFTSSTYRTKRIWTMASI